VSIDQLADLFEKSMPSLDDVKAAMLKAALRLTDDHVVRAAEIMGVPSKTAYNWKKKYNE
jgi:transcriptional regulator of acetoin/glycerol metabolism